MRPSHLSEMEIQQYAVDEPGCAARISSHLAGCAECRAEVAAYRSLFSALSSVPAPVFDFDLEALVLSRIPDPAPQASSDTLLLKILVPACIVAIGLPFYLYRGFLIRWFSGMLPVALWLLILPVAAVLVLQGLDLYKKYQKQMNALNY